MRREEPSRERVYRVCPPGDLWREYFPFWLLGSIFLGIYIVRLGQEFGALVLGAAGWLVFGLARTFIVTEVRMLADGTVEFRRWWRRTRVLVSTIREVASRKESDADGWHWALQIRHDGGKISLRHFPGAKAFAAEVQAVNPYVQVTGPWPPPEITIAPGDLAAAIRMAADARLSERHGRDVRTTDAPVSPLEHADAPWNGSLGGCWIVLVVILLVTVWALA